MSFRNYYDSSYGRSRDNGRVGASTVTSDRPTSVTAKYASISPSYKSSSIPVLNADRAKDETPISAIASRYASYSKTEKTNKYDKPTTSTKYDKKDYIEKSNPKYEKKDYEKPITKYEKKDYIDKPTSKYEKKDYSDKSSSKYEKKDYSKLSIPSLTTNRSRDVSPISTSSKYSLSRPSRHHSPERRSTKTLKDKSRDPSPSDRDKDIPSKTDKSTGYNSLSSYKLYPRSSSYTRTSSRSETKSDITVNRYSIANRLTSNYLRSPPTVRTASVSPINHIDSVKSHKSEIERAVSPSPTNEDKVDQILEEPAEKVAIENGTEIVNEKDDNETETVTMITRHTSPTPPGSSAYVRSRRADMAKTIEKTVTRLKIKPKMSDKEIQSDRLDDPTRSSRFGSTARASMTNWSYYSPNSAGYTGYAGRYSTQYASMRDSTSHSYSDRSSRSQSNERLSKDSSTPHSHSDNVKDVEKPVTPLNNIPESNHEAVASIDQNKDDDTSEIIINVNLKLKKASSPMVTASAALVSPEITITNSQLPPQAPKAEGGSIKVKKTKARKSSTDSSDSSSKKKVVKRRSKSASSTDSDQSNEVQTKAKDSNSPAKKSTNNSTSNLQNGHAKLKHSKFRESNSPESISTLSTQSSISEDDTVSKSKTNDGRTSADENSIPTDRSAKQSSPVASQKNEGTEEAKSFLIRALAPVTNLFKIRHQESTETKNWPDNSTSESTGKDVSNLITESDRSSKNCKNNTNNIIASNDDTLVKLKAIRHIESGERAWWLDASSEKSSGTQGNLHSPSDKNIPKKITHIESGERAWWMDPSNDSKNSNDAHSSPQPPSNLTGSSDLKMDKKIKFDNNDEKPWWLDSSANIPEGIERLTPPRKSSSESDKSEKFNFFKVRHIESGEQKDWWLTSNENSSNSKPDQNNVCLSNSDQRSFSLRRIRHVESGERPWWLSSNKNIPEGIEKLPTPPPQSESDSSDSDEVQVYMPSAQVPPFPLHLPDDQPLGARRSPEGLETPRESEDYGGRASPYENNRIYRRRTSNLYQKGVEKYISRYTDIDDILGTSGQIYSPFMDSILAKRTGQVAFDDDECEEIDPTQVRIHDSTAQMPVIKKLRGRGEVVDYHNDDQLDDATLQVFKDGDYGPYLDLDSTLGEQDEELDGLQESRKNALVLRTQLSVRVHAIIEKLLHSQGRELRKALFTLKQVLQSDKDLVHEFVANKGLDCLMQVSAMADHNYLDYILRALGQILLYVDGMLGVMNHASCIQWLYSLISSKYRHVVKTALKLLLVFVEYTEQNSLLLIEAIHIVDSSNNRPAWYNVMKILQDFDASDTELLIYATTLINRCLNNVPNRDTYYDQVDALQDQGMDDIIQLYMSKQGTDLDLLRQLQIFEAVLLYEDGDESGTALKQLDDSIINSVRSRSLNLSGSDRKSKKQLMEEKAKVPTITQLETETKNSTHRTQFLPFIVDTKKKELSPAIRRRLDRIARQAHHMTQQQELLNNANSIFNGLFASCNGNHNNNGKSPYSNGSYANSNGHLPKPNGHINGTEQCNGVNLHSEETIAFSPTKSCRKDTITSSTPKDPIVDVLKNGNQRYTAGLKQRIQNGTLGHSMNAVDALTVMRQKQIDSPEVKDDRGIILNRKHSIKDLAQRLTNPVSPTMEDKPLRVADMAGIVSKAKEELAKSQSKEVIKSPTIEITSKVHEVKVSENDLHWEELKKGCLLAREFRLCDLDFSDLRLDSDDDVDSVSAGPAGVPPPPPPAMFPTIGIPPPMPRSIPSSRPTLNSTVPAPPPNPLSSELSNNSDSSTIKKNKKTVKLFWKEIQENPLPVSMRSKVGGLIWDDLPPIALDTNMLEHLFESKTNDHILKKLMDPKIKCILDAKRSNAINIAMKKLPTPESIKNAILKMDATAIGREGIEKLLTMLPSEEEKVKIQEAQSANSDIPLGSAEKFLLTLASITELSSRLKLWVFKLDFEFMEKEIAEPLMDLKQGIELLKANKTFKVILSTLRSVGCFLNGNHVKGFRLEYLSKVMEVKDTVHKHPLLYHVCELIINKFPDTTDFFSEVGPVIRASKVDFDMLTENLNKLETECKASWDHMKRVAMHDGKQFYKTKINEFLTDAAERIILLNVVHKRVMSRYNKFLLHFGVPPGDLSKTKPSELLKVVAEFALEYRTTRDRVLQQLEKKANHRERNKTRGKMIIDVGNYATNNGDHSADSALKELLKPDPDTDSLVGRRRKIKSNEKRILQDEDVVGDDVIIDVLVRSATTNSKKRQVPRERRIRLSDNRNLNRTLNASS